MHSITTMKLRSITSCVSDWPIKELISGTELVLFLKVSQVKTCASMYATFFSKVTFKIKLSDVS